jgi:hypothetical protein
MRTIIVAALFAAACGSSNEVSNGGMHTAPDGAVPPDAGVAGQTMCANLSPVSGTCSVAKGGAITLLEGNVLTPGTVYVGGQVAIAANGDVACVGCACATGGETVIACPGASISPGLINVHDHITYTRTRRRRKRASATTIASSGARASTAIPGSIPPAARARTRSAGASSAS